MYFRFVDFWLVAANRGPCVAVALCHRAMTDTQHAIGIDGRLATRGAGSSAAAATSATADASSDLDAGMQGWVPVRQDLQPSSHHPGPRVGGTLSCLEVPLLSKGAGDGGLAARAVAALQGEQQFGLFFFGGDDPDGNQTDKLHVFYLQENRWSCPEAKGRAPTKRSRHSATVVPGEGGKGERLLVFGGVGASNAVSFLEPEGMAWSSVAARSAVAKKKKKKARAWMLSDDDSLLPCARFGHSATYFEERLVVFGGQDSTHSTAWHSTASHSRAHHTRMLCPGRTSRGRSTTCTLWRSTPRPPAGTSPSPRGCRHRRRWARPRRWCAACCCWWAVPSRGRGTCGRSRCARR
jgi:hypothetical protein